jgi:hypothetical protein
VYNRKAGAITCNYLGGATGAEATAHEQGDGLAQGLMGIPGDRDCLGVEVVGNVDGSAHTIIITSLHHDALM